MVFIFSKNNPYQHSKYANSSNKVVGSLYKTTNNIRKYFYLKEENDLLKEQNLKLQEQLRGSGTIVGQYYSRKEDTLYKQQYFYQPATVIRATKDKRYNFLTLNKGSANGIERNMGIVGTKGIVGYVVANSEHFATVLPIIHPKFGLAARHKNSKSFGLLTWTKYDNWETASLNDVPDFISITVGDTIETTGGDGFFPEGELVGTVTKTEKVPGKGTHLITVRLIENYGNIHSVYAIKNITQTELEHLKDSTQIND